MIHPPETMNYRLPLKSLQASAPPPRRPDAPADSYAPASPLKFAVVTGTVMAGCAFAAHQLLLSLGHADKIARLANNMQTLPLTSGGQLAVSTPDLIVAALANQDSQAQITAAQTGAMMGVGMALCTLYATNWASQRLAVWLR